MSQFELDLSYHFKGIEARSPSIQSIIHGAENYNMSYANDFAGDVFNALYQNNPVLSAADNSQYSQAIRAALRSPAFNHLRMQTRGNLHWSSVAAGHITAKLAEQLAWTEEEKPPRPEPPKQEPNEPTEEEGENEGEGNEGDGDPIGEPKPGKGKPEDSDFDENEPKNSQDGDQPKDSDSDSNADSEDSGDNGTESEESPDDSDEDETLDEELDEDSDGKDDEGNEGQESESESESDNEDQAGDDNDPQGSNEDGEDSEGESQPNEPLAPPSKDIEDAINEASREADQLMGGARAGTNESSIGTKEESKLAELYSKLSRNPQLAKIVQMIGRMQISQHFLNGISMAENQTPVSITVGNNIPNVLPQDLGLLLGNREEFIVFANKYNNRELLQREMNAETPSGKGPMIVCMDESGSMFGPRRDWALSITVAMYFQALKEGRQFAVIKFATSASAPIMASSLTRMDVDFMDNIVQEQYLGGGTNFAQPWSNAIRLIRSNKAWKQADIVFVTDGMGNYNPDIWREQKAETKTRLVTFFVDGRSELKPTLQYNYNLKELIGLSDAFTYIDDLSEDGEKQAFEVIRNKDAKGFIELSASTVKRRKK